MISPNAQRDRRHDKTVDLYRTSDLCEVDAIAKALRENDIPCHTDGMQRSRVFSDRTRSMVRQ